MKTCLTPLSGGLGALLACLVFAAPAFAAAPEDAVRDHFARISAQDYTGAAEYFTQAYQHAFKSDIEATETYYLRRREQLAPGYSIIAVKALSDPGRQTARVTVDFNDPEQTQVTVTERMNYYLIREKVESGAPLREADGMAWRIDIYDALGYDSLADARRRPYLYSRDAWPDDEGRELKSRQGLFKIQRALEEFRAATGAYPGKLYGGDDRRDPLLSKKNEQYLGEAYPPSGFSGKPMLSLEFSDKSAGDFTYFSLDANGDGQPDGYFLLLHGKVQASSLFAQHDTILLLGTAYAADESALAPVFAEWYTAKTGKSVTPGPALGPDWQGEEKASPAATPDTTAPAAAPPAATPDAPTPDAPLASDTPAPPPAQPPATEPGQPDKVTLDSTASLVATILKVAAAVAAAPATPDGKLVVHSYGLP